jgi:ATP-dependent helicase/nuclease subunit B
MATIEKTALESGPLWPDVARRSRAWLHARGLAVRDAVVLLPFAALLPPAREAFAAVGGWLPRIETTQTLAASLAPPVAAAPGQLSGDPVLDGLHAAALLRRQPWGAERERQDRRAFTHIVAALVDAALALRRAALLRPPEGRAAFWGEARAALPAAAGPGAFESLLLAVALEWAAQGAAGSTDVLFAHRPAAWIVLRLGGADDLAEAVAAASDAPALVLDADTPGGTAQPERWVCDNAEHEAWAAAAQVIDALNAGRVPVALVALDRVLVRRVRALLDRQAVPLIDETGWTLSTTHAASRLMALLRAAAPGASADDRLAWLKGWPPAMHAGGALDTLEALWRNVKRPGDLAAAQALWARAEGHLKPMCTRGPRSLSAWLAVLQECLANDGSLPRMADDPAGQQLLLALRLQSPDAAWRAAADALPMDLSDFTAWVDGTLEAAQFLPPPNPGAEVVLTPLARAIGRPFGQIVVPGADQSHLGSIEPPPALISEGLAQSLGLDSAARRHARQRLAFARLLHAPAISLLRRRLDGDEPLAASPEVEALALARLAAGTALPPERPWRADETAVAAAPQARPAPAATNDLPQSLSASTVEALRQCPYRFFARAVLRLAERDELDAGLEKRDYGTWLHAVLHRFHSRRGDDEPAQALQRAADEVTAEQQLDSAELLPYRASFETFAPAYVAWLAGREAAGWSWLDGETDRRVAPPSLHPQTLAGRLDRLDRAPDGTLQLIDYKTGSVGALKAKVADPLEDTQLAFYAALEPATRSAIYLALDDPKAPLAIEHPDVAQTAAVLVDHLGGELQRLRAGAGLPALGEGRVCDTCEARGLCRRDHWGAP